MIFRQNAADVFERNAQPFSGGKKKRLFFEKNSQSRRYSRELSEGCATPHDQQRLPAQERVQISSAAESRSSQETHSSFRMKGAMSSSSFGCKSSALCRNTFQIWLSDMRNVTRSAVRLLVNLVSSWSTLCPAMRISLQNSQKKKVLGTKHMAPPGGATSKRLDSTGHLQAAPPVRD